MLAIVVRYFGGIKLGAGGLVRAYTKAVTNTLKHSQYIELIPGYVIEITFSYEEEKNVQYILNKSEIIKKEYLEEIKYQCKVDEETYEKLEKYQPHIIQKEYIKQN